MGPAKRRRGEGAAGPAAPPAAGARREEEGEEAPGPSSGGGDPPAAAGGAAGEPDSSPQGEEEREPRETTARKKRKPVEPGVVYISRLPPFLKPHRVRRMLEEHGEVLKVYLSPEDPAANARRRREGRPTGKSFTEGWVEFADKRVAKRVAGMLNGRQMGGKRRSRYYFDLWNLKYLHKFKWDYLMEEFRYRQKVREQRLAAEISAAKRDRDFYLSRIDEATGIDAMEERKKGKAPKAMKESKKRHALAEAEASTRKLVRKFKQRRAKPDGASQAAQKVSSAVLDLF